MGEQSCLSIEPSCALDAVVATKCWKILGGFAVLEAGKVLRRNEILLDLVYISCFPPRFGDGSFVGDTHDW
jgi:hypothetical protein